MTATAGIDPAFSCCSWDERVRSMTMSRIKYLGCLAITVAVLLDLYAGKPDGEAGMRVILDLGALFLAAGGLAGIATGSSNQYRR